MTTEKEVRFYFSFEEGKTIANKLAKRYKYLYSAHEITIMYDNPNPEFSFYKKEVDGRLRVRSSVLKESKYFALPMVMPESSDKCLVTWKRRTVGDDRKGAIRKEEEIEFETDGKSLSSVAEIFEKVMRCPRVSSYERIRSFFSAGGVQITFDEFPYGIMVEFELTENGGDDLLVKEVEKFGLNLEHASNLSCDDKYFELCDINGMSKKADILFNDFNMPRIIGKLNKI